jgi:hypothetical protein
MTPGVMPGRAKALWVKAVHVIGRTLELCRKVRSSRRKGVGYHQVNEGGGQPARKLLGCQGLWFRSETLGIPSLMAARLRLSPDG